mgnify:CR=1 FL=1
MTQRLNEQVDYCELKEAKTHLKKELRVELEEKQHDINTLNTKVALLKIQEPASLVDIEHREDMEMENGDELVSSSQDCI